MTKSELSQQFHARKVVLGGSFAATFRVGPGGGTSVGSQVEGQDGCILDSFITTYRLYLHSTSAIVSANGARALLQTNLSISQD